MGKASAGRRVKPRMQLHLPRQEIQDLIGIKQLVIIEYIVEQILCRRHSTQQGSRRQ